MVTRVLRTWSARATPEGAERYVAFFDGVLRPQLEALEGFLGARVSTSHARDEAGHLGIHVVTEWASLDAIRRFAGDRMERAVVEPEARALLVSFDLEVAHHDERLRIGG